MTLPHETVLELMAFADGELQGDARARAEQLVATSDEARGVVEAMRESAIGGWLDEAAHAHAAGAGADRIADGVMAAIAAAPADGKRASRGDAGAPAVASFVEARSAKSRRSVVLAIGGGLALAAGIALWLRGTNDGRGERAMNVAPVASVAAPSATVAQQARAAAGVEVNEIDAPSHGVSVFEIPVRAAAAVAEPSGPSSVVVWVDDEETTK
jgi:hypothetical protein